MWRCLLQVEVIPWVAGDKEYSFSEVTPTQSPTRTKVFVGNLHGTMSARGLATIMNDTFGNVESAVIDTDKYKYPIGEFNNK